MNLHVLFISPYLKTLIIVGIDILKYFSPDTISLDI